ncbi:MAG: signal peptidase I [Desulfovibrionaceae bacterium]|nr:signal peptidase I [Desulfovibrionaceae bacterium]
MEEKPKRRRMPAELKRFLIKLAAAAILFTAAFVFVFGLCPVRGDDMHPSVKDGDLAVTLKLCSYRLGDLAVWKDPENGQIRISRIAGLPGFEINVTEAGEFLTNGFMPSEEVFYRTDRAEGSEVEYPLVLGEDEYFLLDDRRPAGRDSRLFGPVKKSCLLGKTVFLLRRRGF